MLGGIVTGGARNVMARLGAAAVALGGGIGLMVAWAAPAAATTYVICYWTGAGADSNWSTAGNWSCDTDASSGAPDDTFTADTGFSDADTDADVVSEVPPSGAIVEFPSGDTHKTVTWD